jgi:hypothetical protein
MLGISLRYFENVSGGSSAGDVSLSEFLGSKNSPTEAEVARHENTASKVQGNSMVEEKAAESCNKLQSGIVLYFGYYTVAL